MRDLAGSDVLGAAPGVRPAPPAPAESTIVSQPGAEMADGDTALVEAARGGDAAAFDALVARHQTALQLYLAHLTGDYEQAHDLSQDVLLRVWHHLLELRDPASFRPWLYRMATNAARSWLRRRRIVAWMSLERLTAPGRESTTGAARTLSALPSPDRDAHDPESGFEDRVAETQALASALRRVPLEYRTCLLLHLSLGFTVAEVAEQLGLTAGAVRMRLVRGLALLREAYRAENA